MRICSECIYYGGRSGDKAICMFSENYPETMDENVAISCGAFEHQRTCFSCKYCAGQIKGDLTAVCAYDSEYAFNAKEAANLCKNYSSLPTKDKPLPIKEENVPKLKAELFTELKDEDMKKLDFQAEIQYFVVQLIIDGFETVMLVASKEKDIAHYIKARLSVPFYTHEISEDFANKLINYGFKVYFAPELDVYKKEES